MPPFARAGVLLEMLSVLARRDRQTVRRDVRRSSHADAKTSQPSWHQPPTQTGTECSRPTIIILDHAEARHREFRFGN